MNLPGPAKSAPAPHYPNACFPHGKRPSPTCTALFSLRVEDMPTINLTNNTDVILTASSAVDGATLNKYLKSVLTLKTPPSFDPLSSLPVKGQRAADFPVALSTTGEGKFAVEKTTLDVQFGPSASIGLLQGDAESDFFHALNLTADPSSSGLVSFGVTGTMSVGDTATESDFTFGITAAATLTLTSYHTATATEMLGDAIKTAIQTLTIPHSIDDLNSLPAGAICRLAATGSLKFSASFTYSFLNDPLATASLGSLPSFAVNATAAATLEGTAKHSSGHTLTIAKLPGGVVQLAVSLKKTDDLETSLTVSAGATATIGDQDALAFLLDKINADSAAEAKEIAAEMPDAAQFKSDIKSAIDTSLSASLAASLRAALEKSTAKNRVFVYAISIAELDGDGTKALQKALTGDFTALTKTGAQFRGINQVDSALTVTAKQTHTLALHFLGIFNAASISSFVVQSKINFTSDTHEVVLSDETLTVVNDNLDAEKLRKVVLKDIILTLPASANTKDAETPITLAYVDREGATKPAKLRQFVNVLKYLGAPQAAGAEALLNRNLKNYGVCSISIGLRLSPDQCRQLFIGPNGAYDWNHYAAALCAAEKAILAGDPDYAYRLPLFSASRDDWNDLREAGASSNITPILKNLGMSDGHAQLAVTDVITVNWWAGAMAAYAKAVQKSQSLLDAGKDVVKDADIGYNEPWMVLAAWVLTGKPAIQAGFFTSL